MATSTAKELFSLLGRSKLLTPEQLAQSRASTQTRGDDVAAIVDDLVRQEFLSRWQGSQLLAGRWSFFLGKYKLIDLLGRGGMGSVFLGEHVTMNRRAALKVLAKQVGKEPGSLERFLDEARMIASLDHPNIVHAFNVDCEGDRYYIVMEYIDGADLQRIVEKEGPMDFARAVDCVRQTADGLAHAHAQGVVHCDIKPSNLILTEQRTIKILDMGLARLVGGDDASSKQEDSVLGSVDYLAPEQAVASPSFDHRADIYSLGCTLYFLLTGQPPFPEGSLAQRIVKHQTQSPQAITELRENAPSVLVDVCSRMMAKEPAERYQSAAEVSQALATWRPAAQPASREKLLPPRKRAEEPVAKESSADDEGLDMAAAFEAADAARASTKTRVKTPAKKVADAPILRTDPKSGRAAAAAVAAVSTGSTSARAAARRGARRGFLSTSKGKWIVGGATGGAIAVAAAATYFLVFAKPKEAATKTAAQAQAAKPAPGSSLAEINADLSAQVFANRTEPEKSDTNPDPKTPVPDKPGTDKPVVQKPDAKPGEKSSDEWQPTVGPVAGQAPDDNKLAVEPPKEPNAVKPEAEKPKPGNKKPKLVEGPKDEPVNETPKAPPVKAAPFSDVVKTVDLPKIPKDVAADAEGPIGEAISLGTVQLTEGTLPEIALLGGTTAMRGANNFQIDAPATSGGKTTWNIFVQAKEGARTDVADISLAGETFRFQWLAGAVKLGKIPGHLRNCGLKLTAGSATHWLALCNPIQVEPLVLDVKAGIERATIPLESAPDAAALRVEVLQLEGSSPKSTFRPSNTLRMPAKGEKEPTNLVAATLDVPEAKGFTVDLQVGFDARGAKPLLAVSACTVTASGTMLLSGKTLFAQSNALQSRMQACEVGLASWKRDMPEPPGLNDQGKKVFQQQKQAFEQQKNQNVKHLEEQKKALAAQFEALKPLVGIAQKLHKNIKVPYKVYVVCDEEKIELANTSAAAAATEGLGLPVGLFDTPAAPEKPQKKKK